MIVSDQKIFRSLSSGIFWFGIVAAIITPPLFFFSLNNFDYAKPQKATADNNEILYYVDECLVKKHSIAAKGWATPKEANGSILVFAIINGESTSLRSQVTNRPKVKKAFPNANFSDHIGFSSSLYTFRKINTAELVIQITKDAKTYVVNHVCK